MNCFTQKIRSWVDNTKLESVLTERVQKPTDGRSQASCEQMRWTDVWRQPDLQYWLQARFGQPYHHPLQRQAIGHTRKSTWKIKGYTCVHKNNETKVWVRILTGSTYCNAPISYCRFAVATAYVLCLNWGLINHIHFQSWSSIWE